MFWRRSEVGLHHVATLSFFLVCVEGCCFLLGLCVLLSAVACCCHCFTFLPSPTLLWLYLFWNYTEYMLIVWLWCWCASLQANGEKQSLAKGTRLLFPLHDKMFLPFTVFAESKTSESHMPHKDKSMNRNFCDQNNILGIETSAMQEIA